MSGPPDGYAARQLHPPPVNAREGSGAGSGKSLAYIVPIVDHVLRHGSGRGIQAIVVYPMNALANSQLGELEKFLDVGPAGTKAVELMEQSVKRPG